METYPVDIDPGQIARWVKAECEITPAAFKISARRKREVREIPVRAEAHLDDQEREDLTEIATVATLEIAPIHASDGWLLSIFVEDDLAPRVFNGDAGDEVEQQIDLGLFYTEYIRPGRGIANVVAEVEDPAAKEHLDRLIEAIETNRHGVKRARRQLQDHVRELQGTVKIHEGEPIGTVARIDPSGEFGFIETSDGREIYFHRNSVLGDGFAQLTEGARVTFAEEIGDKGPQASTVTLMGKHGLRA